MSLNRNKKEVRIIKQPHEPIEDELIVEPEVEQQQVDDFVVEHDVEQEVDERIEQNTGVGEVGEVGGGSETERVVRELMSGEEDRGRDTDDSASDTSSDESDYQEIDMTDNPIYQVLSAFFENEEGENICDHLRQLTDAVRENTRMMSRFLEKSSRKVSKHNA